jgi:hypothetical protein
MRRVGELVRRAQEKLSSGISAWFRETYPFLDPERRRQRLLALLNGRQSKYNKLWKEYGTFFDEMLLIFESLRPVLGPDEVDRLTSEVSSNGMLGNLDSMSAFVQRTSQRVGDFLPANQFPPTQSHQPLATAVTSRGTCADSAIGFQTDEASSDCRANTAILSGAIGSGTTVLREELKAKRAQMLAAAQTRWRETACGRKVPFSWVHAAAKVDHHDAYKWKTGELSEKSQMAVSIGRVLYSSSPPMKPIAKK